MSNATELKKDTFKEAIAGKVALVDFWATWCNPCKMLGPIIDQVAAEIGDAALVAKVNIEEEQELAAEYNVRMLPTILILKNGEIVQQFVGVQSKTKLLDAIRNA
ncbi:thioredoxin [Victivallis sp. Marseille-Q1083]|uniref:thioredoxin n=1 Tax=Victivallis sp. Marseille-Q1083 TaxID=2717288 RepID=UPI00158E6D65|nr:thioredoxin [Victivallis sp. Marseille-Q1083]